MGNNRSPEFGDTIFYDAQSQVTLNLKQRSSPSSVVSGGVCPKFKRYLVDKNEEDQVKNDEDFSNVSLWDILQMLKGS